MKFVTALGDVVADLAELTKQMPEVYLEPKRYLTQRLRAKLGRDYVAGG